VAGLLAAMLWTPAISRHAGREEEHAPAPIPTRAKRDDLKRANPPSCEPQ
jgi:hypothetical protein